MMKRTVGKVEPIQKLWLSKNEAMAYLDCSANFLQTLRDNAQVSFSQVGKMIWYDLKSINLFLERNRVI